MSEQVGSVTRKKSSDFHGEIRFQSSFKIRWEACRGGGTRQSPTTPFGIVGALSPTTSLEIAVYNVRVHHATRSHRGS